MRTIICSTCAAIMISLAPLEADYCADGVECWAVSEENVFQEGIAREELVTSTISKGKFAEIKKLFREHPEYLVQCSVFYGLAERAKARRGQIEELAKLFVAGGATVTNLHSYKDPELFAIALSGHEPLLKIVLDAGADVNVKNRSDMTAMDQRGLKPAIVKLLKARGCKTGLIKVSEAPRKNDKLDQNTKTKETTKSSWLWWKKK